ncbi:hypothetical protein Taro_019316, partial [Colocasia esculenta]|nr:hypothetical protein [Colocasia esculenta]
LGTLAERGGTSADSALSRPRLSSSSFRLRLWKAGIRMGKERASNRNEGFDSKLHVRKYWRKGLLWSLEGSSP